ncbi:hypothetical protein BU16DRAFT_622012 [Lophium mytilinum]|uniref:F-box domain-containing protein n=1 Tax=Lophium mytilinum TaxID=390894 RepID=A0A6A6QE27_9PEZI|nr:hypothetical protein BU16DRAFT_622012 [Lophium mytilinum]
MLLDLPLDLLLVVLSKVTNLRDLKNLCEVSKSLYPHAIELLYRSVTVKAADERHLHEIDVSSLLLDRDKPEDENLLRFTKAIHFTSTFQDKRFERCVHFGGREDFEDIPAHGDIQFDRLAETVLSVLERCVDGNLQSFTWGLGCCIPKGILGSDRYLARHQSSIESIRLIIDGSCYALFLGEGPVGLSALNKLKSIHFTGLRNKYNFKAVGAAIRLNSMHLRKLELDLIATGLMYDNSDYGDNFFADHVLRVSPHERTRICQTLETLSLSAVDFQFAQGAIACAFDLGSLTSLKLRWCPGWQDFLLHAGLEGQPIRLKSLEIQSDSEAEMAYTHTMYLFLGRFEGLEELIISTASRGGTLAIWNSLLHHKSTLKRFFHRQRGWDNDEECDFPDLSLSPSEIAMLTEHPSKNPFCDFDLECVALGCGPDITKLLLSPLTTKRSLQVIHIRQPAKDHRSVGPWPGSRSLGLQQSTASDQDLFEARHGICMHQDAASTISVDSDLGLPRRADALSDFAQWAFGPVGFPSLRIIAFGDFSYGTRFSDTNVLLCRKTERDPSVEADGARVLFCRLRLDDWELVELLERYAGVLEACPEEKIPKYS